MSEEFVTLHGAAFRKSHIVCIGCDNVVNPRRLYCALKIAATEIYICEVKSAKDADEQLVSIGLLLPDFCKLGRILVARKSVLAIATAIGKGAWYTDLFVENFRAADNSICLRAEAFKTKEGAERAVAEYVDLVSASTKANEA